MWGQSGRRRGCVTDITWKGFSSVVATIPKCELDLSGNCESNEHESLKCSG